MTLPVPCVSSVTEQNGRGEKDVALFWGIRLCVCGGGVMCVCVCVCVCGGGGCVRVHVLGAGVAYVCTRLYALSFPSFVLQQSCFPSLPSFPNSLAFLPFLPAFLSSPAVLPFLPSAFLNSLLPCGFTPS